MSNKFSYEEIEFALYILHHPECMNDEKVQIWLESESHQVLLENLRCYREVGMQELLMHYPDVKKQWKLFENKVIPPQRNLRIGWWYGVAVMLVGIMFFFLYRGEEGEKGIPVASNSKNMTILPGSSKATLLLESGRRIELQDTTDLEIAGQDAKIVIRGDSLYYTPGDSAVAPAINTVITPVGGEYRLTLADGTRVWLNAASRLRFPSVFTGEQREVQVEGEAYFEVAKDSRHPFLVRSGDVVVKVLGTSFNVRAYPDEAYRATLVEGSVAVDHRGQETRIVPGQQWSLVNGSVQVREVNLQAIASWRTGNFAFEDVPLPELFKELERWYEIRVSMSGESVQNLKFTGIFPRYGDLDRVLEIIELVTCVRCTVNDRTVIVSLD